MARQRRGFRHREPKRTRANRSPKKPRRGGGRGGVERTATADPDVSASNGGGAVSFMVSPYRTLARHGVERNEFRSTRRVGPGCLFRFHQSTSKSLVCSPFSTVNSRGVSFSF